MEDLKNKLSLAVVGAKAILRLEAEKKAEELELAAQKKVTEQQEEILKLLKGLEFKVKDAVLKGETEVIIVEEERGYRTDEPKIYPLVVKYLGNQGIKARTRMDGKYEEIEGGSSSEYRSYFQVVFNLMDNGLV